MALKVNELSDEAAAMRPRWVIVETLLGGTWAMRAAGKAYLQQWPQEDTESYNYRLQTSTLFNAFARTIGNMASKPFTEPLKWTNIEPTVEAWFDNIDLQGRNLHVFAQEVFKEGLAKGLTHILADFPVTRDKDGKPLAPTLADERKMGLRPYLIHVKPASVLGWISNKVNGVEVLTQVRIMESVSVPDGEFATKTIDQVRLLTPGAWQTYRQDEKNEWQPFENGVTSLTFIPLVTFYTNRTGFMQAVPPLADLADLNVQHWNLQSDSDCLLHTASVPILTVTGIEDTTKIVVGAKAALILPIGATASYTEHTGQAIGAGRTRIKDLEDQMRIMGAELTVAQPGDVTATQSSIDTAQAQCQLGQMAEAFGDVLDECVVVACSYVGLGDQGEIAVFDDFASAPVTSASMLPFVQALTTLVAGGLLSEESAFLEAQRANAINDDLDWEVEKEKISAAAPVLKGTPLVLGTKPAAANEPFVKPAAAT